MKIKFKKTAFHERTLYTLMIDLKKDNYNDSFFLIRGKILMPLMAYLNHEIKFYINDHLREKYENKIQ